MEPNIARVLLNAKEEDKKQRKTSPSPFQFDPSVMVDMFPGPALLVGREMNVVYHNVFAKSLLGPIHEEEVFLKAMISRCLDNGCPDTQKATLGDCDGLRHYDLYAFPLKEEQSGSTPTVFLFGKETTIEHNLTNALVESRQMFKDLVSCSTDFAWETDSNGNFIYVSPKGILGYTAYELNGKNSRDMIIGGEERNPFDTMDKVNEMELWLKRSDGALACLLISAVPVLDNQAKWQGARGICRDITHIREREAVLRRTHRREHVLNKLIATIRNMVSPAEMLEKALKATMEGIKVDSCYIIQKTKGPEGGFNAEIKQQQGEASEPDLIDTLCQQVIEYWQDTEQATGKTEMLQIGKYRILLGITNHHATDNGAIFLIRNMGKDQNMELTNDLASELTSGLASGLANGWNEDEIHLFTGITNHLGIALEQVITHEELEKRAFTDELTKLLNRRAFTQEINKRIKNQKRSHKEGALLYLDLDNFKNVNDSKGHACGDKILIELARIIQSTTRVSDYSARLGGDEFAIWLDEISEKDAAHMADNFITAGSRLAHIADVAGPQLSISIGVAMSHPEQNQTFNDLMEKADSALYQAKAKGKATYIIYKPDHREPENNQDISTLQESDNDA